MTYTSRRALVCAQGILTQPDLSPRSHSATPCTSTTIAEHIITEVQQSQSDNRAVSERSPKPEHTSSQQKINDGINASKLFQRKGKNMRVSISSVVCSCLHLSRKEELIWATIDERQHRKLFLLPLHYLPSQKKQTAVTISQVLYAM